MRILKNPAGRRFPRLNKTLIVQLQGAEDDSPRDCSLHVMDISEEGLRVNTHEKLTEGSRFSLSFPLQSFGKNLPNELTINCEVGSCKSLYGGHNIHDLVFVEMEQEQKQTLQDLLEGLSRFGGRLHPRFDILMPVEMQLDKQQMSIVVIRNLSHGGVGFRSKHRLAQNSTLKIRLPIPGGQWVTGDIKVAWKSYLEGGVFEYGAAFCDITDHDKSLLDELIRAEAK